MEKKDNGFKLVANNKKAYFDYFIEDKWEAGIALYGTCLLYTSDAADE